MYYPFLRGRQFELIALRNLSRIDGLHRFVCPIIEPVRKSINNLNLSLRDFNANDFSAYLILNPSVGEISNDPSYLIEYYNTLENSNFKPAIRYNNTEQTLDIIESIDRIENLMIILNEDVDNSEFLRFVNGNDSRISKIVFPDPGSNRALKRSLQGIDIDLIRLDDKFQKEDRNSDYLNIPERKFTEEHLFFNDENFSGFSDYTLISKEFQDGGSTPRAVVIHMSYLDSEKDNEIWMRHFTSINNGSIANIQGKFGEALEKCIRFYRELNYTNIAIDELNKYFDESHYPGLGTIKKLSITNHLILVSEYLRQNG